MVYDLHDAVISTSLSLSHVNWELLGLFGTIPSCSSAPSDPLCTSIAGCEKGLSFPKNLGTKSLVQALAVSFQ